MFKHSHDTFQFIAQIFEDDRYKVQAEICALVFDDNDSYKLSVRP